MTDEIRRGLGWGHPVCPQHTSPREKSHFPDISFPFQGVETSQSPKPSPQLEFVKPHQWQTALSRFNTARGRFFGRTLGYSWYRDREMSTEDVSRRILMDKSNSLNSSWFWGSCFKAKWKPEKQNIGRLCRLAPFFTFFFFLGFGGNFRESLHWAGLGHEDIPWCGANIPSFGDKLGSGVTRVINRWINSLTGE